MTANDLVAWRVRHRLTLRAAGRLLDYHEKHVCWMETEEGKICILVRHMCAAVDLLTSVTPEHRDEIIRLVPIYGELWKRIQEHTGKRFYRKRKCLPKAA